MGGAEGSAQDHRPAVLISVPTTGWTHKRVDGVLLKLQRDPRYRLRIILPTHTPFENNLHHIIGDFLRGGEDYWLTIDADNPPVCNPLDLVSLDLDIVGCPTPVWHWTGEKPGERPIYLNAYDYDDAEDAYREHLPHEGLQRVDAVGTGCVLFARRVFEQPYQGGAFTRRLNPDGTVERGNDISFCERAMAAGWKVWAHYDYQCDHHVELSLREVATAYAGLRGGGNNG